MPGQRRKGVDMTDHGFDKWDYDSVPGKIMEAAKRMSKEPGVVCTHVLKSDRGHNKWSIIAFRKGVKSEDIAGKLDAIAQAADSPSRETLEIKHTYRDGKHKPSGWPHAFGCLIPDEPTHWEET
jgi:hypothetical protein